MKTNSATIYSLVDPNEKDYVFVRGNTKYLKNLDQKDLEILYKNGDSRVKIREDKAAVAAPPAEDKKSTKQAAV